MALGARGTEEAAKPMGIAVQDRGAQDPNELGRVFEELKKDRPDALLTMIDPFTINSPKRDCRFHQQHTIAGNLR